MEFEPLPAGLQERQKAVGEAWSEGFAASAQAAAPRPGLGHMAPTAPTAPAASAPPRSGWGWWAAAAAGLMAIVGWWPQLTGSPTELRTPVAGVEPERGQSTASELRAELLAASDALRIDWTATDFAAGATGDVVWSQADQRGFLRIEGLAVNDPTELQYQLWIFDDEQEHPVDGGVFDIGSDGEVIVPIDAKLTVAAPTLFAVTIEKPGGVVVSDQQRIALVGQV